MLFTVTCWSRLRCFSLQFSVSHTRAGGVSAAAGRAAGTGASRSVSGVLKLKKRGWTGRRIKDSRAHDPLNYKYPFYTLSLLAWTGCFRTRVWWSRADVVFRCLCLPQHQGSPNRGVCHASHNILTLLLCCCFHDSPGGVHQQHQLPEEVCHCEYRVTRTNETFIISVYPNVIIAAMLELQYGPPEDLGGGCGSKEETIRV